MYPPPDETINTTRMIIEIKNILYAFPVFIIIQIISCVYILIFNGHMELAMKIIIMLIWVNYANNFHARFMM